MNTMNPDSPSAFGGHDDNDDNAATGPTHTGRDGSTQTRPDRVHADRVHADRVHTDRVHTGQAASTQTRPDQPLYAPLPYGTGFSSPQPLGFGVGPADVGFAASGSGGSAIEVAEHKRAGSPILAVAGLLSMGVAVWAILGAPVITPTILLAAGLVLTVLVGLVMVIRR